MKKTKANFRAKRESVGISQQRLADLLDVKVLSVKRWENPEYAQMPPENAWKILEFYKQRQHEQLEYALQAIEEQSGNEGFDGVDLTYWRSAEHFEAEHDNECGDDWQAANATSRIIAHHLELKGLSVTFDFPGLKSVKTNADEISYYVIGCADKTFK